MHTAITKWSQELIEAKKREIGGEVLFPRSSFREIGRSSFQEIEGSGKRKKCPDLDHICIMITLINTGINNVIVTVLSFSLSLSSLSAGPLDPWNSQDKPNPPDSLDPQDLHTYLLSPTRPNRSTKPTRPTIPTNRGKHHEITRIWIISEFGLY